MAEHYATKLKRENAKLREDLYKILDGDVETRAIYLATRGWKQLVEEAIWFGSPTIKDTLKFNGLLNKIK